MSYSKIKIKNIKYKKEYKGNKKTTQEWFKQYIPFTKPKLRKELKYNLKVF